MTRYNSTGTLRGGLWRPSAATRGLMRHVYNRMGQLQRDLMTFRPAATSPIVPLAPTVDMLEAARISPARLVLMNMPDFTSLSAFAQLLGVPTSFLRSDVITRVCLWAQRSADFYECSALYIDNPRGFRDRIVRYHEQLRRATAKVLNLVAGVVEDAVFAAHLRASVAEPLRAHDPLPLFPRGDEPVRPFKMFTDNPELEVGYETDEEDDEPDSSDDDGAGGDAGGDGGGPGPGGGGGFGGGPGGSPGGRGGDDPDDNDGTHRSLASRESPPYRGRSAGLKRLRRGPPASAPGGAASSTGRGRRN